MNKKNGLAESFWQALFENGQRPMALVGNDLMFKRCNTAWQKQAVLTPLFHGVKNTLGEQLQGYDDKAVQVSQLKEGAAVSCFIEPAKGSKCYLLITRLNSEQLLISMDKEMESRTEIQRMLRQQQAVEESIDRLSNCLSGIHLGNLDVWFDMLVAEAGKLCLADRSYIFSVSEDCSRLSNTHEWCAPGIPSVQEALQNVPAVSFHWWLDKLKNNDDIVIENVDKMEKRAAFEKEELKKQGICSVIALPLMFEGRLTGFFGLDAVTAPHHWNPSEIALLRLFGSFILHTQLRKWQNEEIAEARAELQALHGLLPICFSCHKIRDDKGYWHKVEQYIGARSEAEFTHGLCPDCREKFNKEFQKDG